jgi:hypothetical protein
MGLCPPNLQGGLHLQKLIGMDLDMRDRMVGIHPDADRRGAGCQHDLTGFQLQHLGKTRTGEGIRIELDSHPAWFQEFPILTPGIILADQKNDVAVLFRPDVQADVAIAQRHRVVFVFAETRPRHIIFGGIGEPEISIRILRGYDGQHGPV